MSRKRIWIAGPRAWEAEEPIERLVRKLVANHGIARLLVVTGGATGVDRLVEDACYELGVMVFACRAAWPVGRHAGPLRNRLIAQEFEPDLLIALYYFDLNGTSSHPGTKSAIREARRAGIPVKTIKVRPATAIPSAHALDSPMGNRARNQLGVPEKPSKAARRRAAKLRRKRLRDA